MKSELTLTPTKNPRVGKHHAESYLAQPVRVTVVECFVPYWST